MSLLRGFNLVFPAPCEISGSSALTIPSLSIEAHGGGRALLSIPAPELTASGTAHSSKASLTIPAPILTARGGGTAAMEIPALTLSATGTVPQLGRANLEISAPILIAIGKTGLMGSASLTIPEPTLTTQTGGQGTMEIPALTLTASGKLQNFANATITIPAPTLMATGQVWIVGRASLEIPSPLIVAGMGNRASLEIPALMLVATATNTGTTAEVAAETTYAINLNTGAVTTLVLGGFDKLVTAHGRLYGLKNGTLTRLEGNVDGTDTEIPATVRFAPQQFGTNQVKRLSDVYLNSRENDGVSLTLVADETTSWVYQTPTDTAPAIGTHKVKTGRGVTFHSAGLILQNRDGGKLDIGGLELLVQPLSRRPK